MVYVPTPHSSILRQRMQEECDRWPPKLWKPTAEEEFAVDLKYRSLNRGTESQLRAAARSLRRT